MLQLCLGHYSDPLFVLLCGIRRRRSSLDLFCLAHPFHFLDGSRVILGIQLSTLHTLWALPTERRTVSGRMCRTPPQPLDAIRSQPTTSPGAPRAILRKGRSQRVYSTRHRTQLTLCDPQDTMKQILA
ncbi:uncharacterized protein SCHCODRAFT_02305968 [Schizophyllum commune H4-8]|uniref:uncharacterized protein n=1 Tax=Schizophyllum commune (strain H4-8 / FGSC 9210) TaxID=578458 RepID=UPI00215F2705|nr:uncharacterized protein SCHCODRAFT_02305968 [Schizophyllum commune H4-8]KAI5890911.1 hypothetical protein SCHCODRAFT_02305968 [Schizophyllum commune H4-8]